MPEDPHTLCACGLTAFEALGGIAREVPGDVSAFGLVVDSTGQDVCRPIECPCGRDLPVIWHVLGSGPELDLLVVPDDDDCPHCAAGHPAIRLEDLR